MVTRISSSEDEEDRIFLGGRVFGSPEFFSPQEFFERLPVQLQGRGAGGQEILDVID